MSIPPLVCSTPPPPDQCEEDKDSEYYDIPYNLSQDDDDDNYAYGNYSSYNQYETPSPEMKKSDIAPEIPEPFESISNSPENKAMKEEHEYPKVLKDSGEVSTGTNCSSDLKNKSDEDISIEDLNLKLDVVTLSTCNEGNSEKPEIVDSLKNIIVEEVSPHNISKVTSGKITLTETLEQVLHNDESILPSHENVNVSASEVNTQNSDAVEHVDLFKSKENSKIPEEQHNETLNGSEIISEVKENQPNTFNIEEDNIEELNIKQIESNPIDIDNDFGDFDDFKFASTNQPIILNSCDNPWETNDNSDFGDFTANFDEPESTSKLPPSDEVFFSETKEIEIQPNNSLDDDDNDDFGDFNNFKSSPTEENINENTDEVQSMGEQVPVLDFQSSDNEYQVLESINKVLCLVFEQEISEPETEFDGKLESFLGETWGHLTETDERQPYIVHWNNSLGQKTLLRALCIDSRNILFGPKWSYNMPKYAVNLSNAPLQPQKHPTSNTIQSEASSSDKPAPKPVGWTDPFTSDGQESCNTEPGTPSTEISPTDLDMLEATISSKPERIFSSSPNLQPLRQINLPDTHIFTPTDSETPRSKTIHYDGSLPVSLPQTTLNSGKGAESSSHLTDSDVNDDDYSDFQDFKSNSATNTAVQNTAGDEQKPESIQNKKTTANISSASSASYQTQILQPIKMDVLMPTLNWPDPGEVKETFEDFTDFISNSAWSNEPKVTHPPSLETSKFSDLTAETPGASRVDEVLEEPKEVPVTSNVSADFDDEFDTFKSALPSPAAPSFNAPPTNKEKVSSPQTLPNLNSNAFPRINNFKADSISFPNVARQNEILTQTNSSKSTELSKNSASANMLQPGLLQPTPASGAVLKQNKPDQILHPLSLESFSQINWPSPGIDLQDLSRFNPVETLQSLNTDLSAGGPSRNSPAHGSRPAPGGPAAPDDDVWGEFVSSKPRPKPSPSMPKKPPAFVDDDEWTDFVSSPTAKPPNGLNTISLNVHTGSSMQKSINPNSFPARSRAAMEIPTLNYITPKANHAAYRDKHFQNL